MHVTINVPRVLQAMRQRNWGIRETCSHCGLSHRTLQKFLNGKMPQRLDSWYRLCSGLGLNEMEVLNAATHSLERQSCVPSGRRDAEITQNGEEVASRG